MNELLRLITAPDDLLQEFGSRVAKDNTKALNDRSVNIYTDERTLMFLPAIIAEGNLDFMKACAVNMYDDSRKDVIIEFLDELWKLTIKGERLLDKKV